MAVGVMKKTKNKELRKQEFLALVEKHLEINAACRELGVNPRVVYEWRKEDPEFEKAVQEAKGHAVDILVASAYKRALNEDGKYDERTAAILTMFLIKGQRPIYKDSFKADIDVGTVKFTFQIPKPEGLSDVPQLPAGPVLEADFTEEDG